MTVTERKDRNTLLIRWVHFSKGFIKVRVAVAELSQEITTAPPGTLPGSVANALRLLEAVTDSASNLKSDVDLSVDLLTRLERPE